MGKPYILLGDKSSHGGVVISASTTATINGKGIARVGDKVTCPVRGHGEVTTIISGDPDATIDGKAPARHGDKTACGATLIASQSVATDEPGGADRLANARVTPAVEGANLAAEPSTSQLAPISPVPEATNELTIESKLYPNLSRGEMKKINAVVLHRTAGGTASSTLNAYAKATVGAHFLIDVNGRVYQTLETSKMAAHVGTLRPRCLDDNSGTAEERMLAAAIRDDPKVKRFSDKVTKLHRLELKKSYPARYPSNEDSVGIEVVGKYVPDVDRFEPATPQQLQAVFELVQKLMREHALSRSDVYPHHRISYKSGMEGEGLGF